MRPLLGKALIGELLPALQLAYHAFKDFCGCGERRELACELRPRMLTPDQVPERPGLQFRGRVGGVDLQRLLYGPLPGREMLDLLVFGFFRRRRGSDDPDACLGADGCLDLAPELRVFLEEVARVVLALPQPVALVDIPGARLFEHAEVDADFEHFAFARDALAVQDVELGMLEGRR